MKLLLWPESNHEETLGNPQLMDIVKNNWSKIFKSVKSWVSRKGRIHPMLKEIEETGQCNAMQCNMCVCVCVCVCILWGSYSQMAQKKVSNCVFNAFICLWLFQNLKEKKNRWYLKNKNLEHYICAEWMIYNNVLVHLFNNDLQVFFLPLANKGA